MNAFMSPRFSADPMATSAPIIKPSSTMPAPAPKQNAFAAKAAAPMPASSPAQNPFAISQPASPGPLANAFKGFATGLLGVDKINAMDDRYKAQDAEEGKKKLAMLQQFRAMPVDQRMAALPQLSQAIGKEIPPDTMSDQAIDAQVAMMSGQLGIAPATPEAARYQGMGLGDGGVGVLNQSTGKMEVVREPTAAAPKPVQKEYDYKEVGNRVIAINKNDPSDRVDVGPVKPTGSGSGSGLTPYQEMQSQFKIDDTAREVSAAAQKGRASLQTLDNSIALLDKFTGDTAKFTAVYGNGMNPTGKKDDLFNWSIGMDDNRKDGMAMLDQLGGQAFIDSIRDMKSAGGAGSLSDAEGSKLATAATRLMTVNQTDAAAKEAADEFRLRLTRFRNFLEQDMAAIQEAEQRRSAQLQTMMGRPAESPQQSPTQQAPAPIDAKVVQNPAMKMAIRAYAQQTGMPADAITEFLSNPATPQEIAEFNGAFGAGKAEAILKAMQNGR